MCGAKLATVTNQPVARPTSTSIGKKKKKKILFNKLKVSTVTDLVEMFKSGTLSRKIWLSVRAGSGMHLWNGNEQKREKIKTFPIKWTQTVFIFS